MKEEAISLIMEMDRNVRLQSCKTVTSSLIITQHSPVGPGKENFLTAVLFSSVGTLQACWMVTFLVSWGGDFKQKILLDNFPN